MSKPHNRCFPIQFLSGIKICKMGTTIARHFSYVKPTGFYPRFWWERWGHYRPHLEEILSGFFWTITWPILVHLACPRARFNRTREGYKMISSEIHQTRGLPVVNTTRKYQKASSSKPQTTDAEPEDDEEEEPCTIYSEFLHQIYPNEALFDFKPSS